MATTVSLVSAGKFLTHVAALQLVDRGLATLDEPISRLLPELKDVPVIVADGDPKGHGYALRVPAKPITLRHMLTNSSGIASDDHPLVSSWRQHSSKREFPDSPSLIIQRLWSPLQFEPGEGWNYGHDVHFLQVVIERASGEDFVPYVQKHVFDALGMTASAYSPQSSRVSSNLLQPVERGDGGNLRSCPEGMVSGITCSMANLQTLSADLISPSPILLKPETRALLFQPGFSSFSPALTAFSAQAAEFAAQVGLRKEVASLPVNYTCAGAMLVEGHGDEELNLPPGTLAWDGSPNVAWAMHLRRGIAMVFATQLLPEYDEKTMPPRLEFFKGARARFLGTE